MQKYFRRNGDCCEQDSKILSLIWVRVSVDFLKAHLLRVIESVRIWGVSWNGILKKTAGIVHAMDQDSAMKEN